MSGRGDMKIVFDPRWRLAVAGDRPPMIGDDVIERITLLPWAKRREVRK